MLSREKTTCIFHDLLQRQNPKSLKKKEYMNFAQKIEKSIYDWAKQYAEKEKIDINHDLFKTVYRNKAISIYTNLDPNSYVKNTDFLKKVIENDVDVCKVATLTPQEMFSKNWKTLLDRKFKIDKNLYETRTEMATDMYKCGKCKKRVCTYFQLQTRSADEPMTTFVTCLKCGNRWKH